MIVDIRHRTGDDRTFLTAVNSLLARLVVEFEPERVFAIRLSKWFDHKWLGYSGIGRVSFPGSAPGIAVPYGFPRADTALDEHSQSKLTLPPFNPKQVIGEVHWGRNDDCTYSKVLRPAPVHRRILEHSSANLHRRIRDRWPSAIFLWFSSNTATNGHGSVMVYVTTTESQSSWYASFSQSRGWRIDRVKGTRKEIVQRWFPLG